MSELKEKLIKEKNLRISKGKPPFCFICQKQINENDDFEYVLAKGKQEIWLHKECFMKEYTNKRM